MRVYPLRILCVPLLSAGLSGCVTTDASPIETVRAAVLTPAQKHELEQKRISLEQELIALESTSEIQRLMGGYGSLEEAPVSLAVEQTYSVTRYYQLKAMIARIDHVLQ